MKHNYNKLYLLILLMPLLVLSGSCLSMSHGSNISPVASPVLLQQDEVAGGFGGTVAGGGLTFFPISGAPSISGELHNSDFVYVRWGAHRRSRVPYDLGVNLYFLYSMQSLNKSMIGGEFLFSARRLIMQTRRLSATWMTGGGIGTVFSFPNDTLQGSPEYYSIKLSLPNTLRWYTDLGYHNVYWGAGFNLTVDILWGLNAGALVFMDYPFVVGYLLMFMNFHFFTEIGLMPSLVINSSEGVYLITSVSVSIGFHIGGKGSRVIRPKKR